MLKNILPIFDIDEFKYQGKEDDFYANLLSIHLKEHKKNILSPHRHSFYLSVLFTKGTGTHEIEFNKFKIQPGKVFMMMPGQVHNWELSKDIEGYIFFHSKDFFNLNFTFDKVTSYPFFSCLRNTPQIVLKKAAIQQIELIYKEIIAEYHQNNLLKFQKITSLINLLYINLSREYIPDKIENYQHLGYLSKLQELEKLIDINFKTAKYPKLYAEMMHISVKHLTRICKTCINKTVSEIISDRIILEAKRMMAFSKNNISEIIYELGYEDNSYFSRLFKKKTGKTPSDFMNSIGNKSL